MFIILGEPILAGEQSRNSGMQCIVKVLVNKLKLIYFHLIWGFYPPVENLPVTSKDFYKETFTFELTCFI